MLGRAARRLIPVNVGAALRLPPARARLGERILAEDAVHRLLASRYVAA